MAKKTAKRPARPKRTREQILAERIYKPVVELVQLYERESVTASDKLLIMAKVGYTLEREFYPEFYKHTAAYHQLQRAKAALDMINQILEM